MAPWCAVTGWLRAAAWSCVAALAVLSLLPAEEMMRAGLGGRSEHAMAYAGTAFLVGPGYRAQEPGRIAAVLVAHPGALELLQHFSPDRHPAVSDWLASSVGVLVGTAAFHLAAALNGATASRRGRRRCRASAASESRNTVDRNVLWAVLWVAVNLSSFSHRSPMT
jgi:VanZ family protein